jgi:hypothetical protein
MMSSYCPTLLPCRRSDLRGGGISRRGTESAPLALIDEKIRSNTEAMLDEVRRADALPRTAALSLTTERVRRAMRTRRWDGAVA